MLLLRKKNNIFNADSRRFNADIRGCFIRDNLRLKDKGFMLLEVILSILIIGSGLVVVIRSYTISIRASQIARGLGKACLFSEDKLFDIDFKGFKDGVKKVEKSGAEEGYSWYLVGRADDREKITPVDLTVSWKRHNINILTLRRYKEG